MSTPALRRAGDPERARDLVTEATVPAAGGSALRSLARAAAILWLPAGLPLFLGPLSECGHCVRIYWMVVPIVPGFIARMVVPDAVGIALAAVLTLLLLAGLTLALRRLPQPAARWVGILAACLTGAQALILGNLLRM